jgi:predicted DNA-binding protein (MmcQ/YjbR family)
MNKVHWNSVILDGIVPEDTIREMIAESFDLTKPKTTTLWRGYVGTL